jgi:hypothetical protein
MAAVHDEWGRRSVTIVNGKNETRITGPKLLLPEIRSALPPIAQVGANSEFFLLKGSSIGLLSWFNMHTW